VEKDLLTAIGKENMGVISKTMSFLRKRSLELLFGKPIYIQIAKCFRDGHISEHAACSEMYPYLKHAQFKVSFSSGRKHGRCILSHA
jgi:hypothetical protein